MHSENWYASNKDLEFLMDWADSLVLCTLLLNDTVLRTNRKCGTAMSIEVRLYTDQVDNGPLRFV